MSFLFLLLSVMLGDCQVCWSFQKNRSFFIDFSLCLPIFLYIDFCSYFYYILTSACFWLFMPFFSRFLRQEHRSLIWDFSFFSIYVFSVISNTPSTCLLPFNVRIFLIFILFNLFLNFETPLWPMGFLEVWCLGFSWYLMLVISSLILSWPEKTLCVIFIILKFVETCFMAQDMVYILVYMQGAPDKSVCFAGTWWNTV